MFQDFFLWKPEYSVKIKLIDEQHKKIIEILNVLYYAFLEKEHKKKVEEIIRQLEDYTVNHFGTEEKYFSQFKYNETAEHIAQHDEFKNQVKVFREQFEKDNAVLTFSIINYLREWVNKHIMVEDKKYSTCFIENGLE